MKGVVLTVQSLYVSVHNTGVFNIALHTANDKHLLYMFCITEILFGSPRISCIWPVSVSVFDMHTGLK